MNEPMNEPMNQDSDRMLQRLRQHLDRSSAELDGATLSKLNRARQHALDAASPRAAVSAWRRPLLVGSAMAALVGVWLLHTSHLPTEPVSPMAGADLELLAAGEDLELIENLEFYAWLQTQSQGG